MRLAGPPSEIKKFAAPLAKLVDGAWRRMHWWIGAMALLYLLSGITIVKPDEAAIVLRWGRLVGATPALQQHGPGLLFAFPKPVDQIVRVQVKRVWEIPVTGLMADSGTDSFTLNPLQGYAITGDHNIVHVNMVARYRIRNPAAWSFYGAKAEDILRVEVMAAMVRSLGEMGVDRVLSDGRKDLIASAARRVQAGLDTSGSGLELASLELTKLSPPSSLASDFDAVQSAYIDAETSKKRAQTYRESLLPESTAKADETLQTARADAASDMAAATGEGAAFRSLEKQYRANPGAIRERLYRNSVDKALGGAGKVQWIPPPVGGRYHGFRVSLGGRRPGSGSRAVPDEDER